MTASIRWNLRTGRKFWAAAAIACVLFAAALPARAAERDAADILKAVVGVRAKVPETARTAQALGTIRRGSGVLIEDHNLILTIGFLIMEADDAFIIGPGGEPIKAEVIAYDWESGFGLLRTVAPVKAEPIPFGSTGKLKSQDHVLIAAHGGEGAVSPAVVVDRRDFPGYWEYLLEDAIFTAPINTNHPGAALLAPDGRLLGIGYLAVGDVTDSGRMNPGNMFVPIDRIKPIIADLKQHGRSMAPPKPWLGIFTNESGGRVFVTLVAPDGPADKAGLKAGAIVLAVAGDKVEDQSDFFRKVWALGEAGTPVALTVLEGTDIREVTVQSGNRYKWLRIKHSH